MDNQAAVLWQTIIAEVQVMNDQISEFSFKTWFEPAELVEVNNERITITHPNPFAITQFEKRFHKIIIDILKKNGFNEPEVSYIIKKKNSKVTPIANTVSQDQALPMSPMSSIPKSGLNKQYTFQNFIVGNCNDMAYSVAQAIAKSPGVRYNPLYVYGGVGLGKTHLIQAIGNELEDTLKLKVKYLTAEDFTNDFLDHIKNKKSGFENRYRNVDVLIIDDIQFIAGKNSTQETFFHTFNALHQKNKQIILSSDCLPDNIPTLADRLKSRFRMGMVVDISLPDTETRTAIIESKAQEEGILLTHEVAEYIAENVKTNIREIEGVVKQLISYVEMRNLEPNIELVQVILNDMRPNITKHFTHRQIINKTAEYFNVKPEEITCAPPAHLFAKERHIAMYLIRSELRYSYPQTAKAVNRQDHTTARSAVIKIEKRLKLDTLLNEQISAIREKLYV
jgi:chromosomal replication initiator protein